MTDPTFPPDQRDPMLRLLGVDPARAALFQGEPAFYRLLVLLSGLVALLGLVGMTNLLLITGRSLPVALIGGLLWASVIFSIDLLIAQPTVETANRRS